MSILQDKIQQIKQRAAPISFSTIAINENEDVVTLEDRVIRGYLVKWNNKNMFNEVFVKGAFAKSIRERGPGSQAKYKLTFLWQHDQHDPLALFAVLKEDDFGLYFETMPLDDVPNAERAIKQIKSGTLNQFSVGFDYVWDKIEYDEKTDSLILLEVDLFEGSVVTIGADMETFAIRSKEGLSDLHDDIEDFINQIPRKDRLQARKLFALQKSLIPIEPFEQRKKTLNEDKKDKKAIDYSYLLNSL